MNTEPEYNLILSEDPVAGELLSEIYSFLKSKPSRTLSISESCWIDSIDRIQSENQEQIDNQIDWYIKVGNRLLAKKEELSPREAILLDSLKDVMNISSENHAFNRFFSELEESADALFRLDYSKKTEFTDNDPLGEVDLLKYTAMTLNMAADKFRYSVLSNKVVNTILNSNSGIGVIVTDTKGEIRFISNFIEDLIGDKNSTYVGKGIDQLIDISAQELGSRKHYGIKLLSPNRLSEPQNIDLKKVIAENDGGEIDECVYLIYKSQAKPIISYQSRVKNINEIIDSIEEGIEDKSVSQSGQIALLRENLSRLSEYGIDLDAENGMEESFNVKKAITSQVAKFKEESGSKNIEYLLDLSDDLQFLGNSDLFTDVLHSGIKTSQLNFELGAASKITVAGSNLHNCLVLIIMDTGTKLYSKFHGAEELVKIQQLVDSIGGSMKVNSKYNTGNSITLILPF